jgi:DNA-binding IclR family transcriptional regulator
MVDEALSCAAAADSDRYTVPGLERGLRILAEFSRHEPVLTAPELARRLGAPRSTVFRLLVTLEQMGYVERTADGRAYRLGLAVLRLGFEYLGSLGMVELGRPILERVRDETGYGTSLVVRDGREVVFVLRAVPRSPFASTVSIGTRLPAHATVLGHALLSDQSLAQLRALYPDAALPARGPQTPTDAQALFEMAQQVRARGYVISEGFYEAHICTVAAPVFGEGNHVVAAIGLNVPGPKLPEEQKPRLVAAIRGAAAELSTLLNYAEDPGPGARAITEKPRVVPAARKRP